MNTDALARLDRALLDLRRFLAAPPVVADRGAQVELSTVLVLDAVVAAGEAGALVRDVADRLDVAPSTASRLVDRAVLAGMVDKVRGENARQVRVEATDEGRALAARAVEHRQEQLAQVLEGWTVEERASLVGSLEHLAQSVRGRSQAGDPPSQLRGPSSGRRPS